ncbi:MULTISPECIES: hypothetical protein [Sphingomonas]|uniref:Uncharacterized protein n=1 Tax=Sphingomonas kyungheensis TaxID=1069987 RepID=A0ABU8H7T1_9SPHN|nr:hypothetical protein [Sphingomonas sp. CV7422]
MTIDNRQLEQAILDLLATRPEIYPAQMVGELKPRHAGISLARMHDVLECLFAEHRVARLWHRYLLPSDVRKVRTKWLDRLQPYADQLGATGTYFAMFQTARDIVTHWDGWSVEARDLTA